LTAFAGSIGIIGIALILSISHGVDTYINRVQRDTLSSYPLEIESHTMDMPGTRNSLSDMGNANRETEEGKVYSGSRMTNTMSSWVSGYRENDLESFKKWLDDPANGIDRLVSGIQYEYTTPLTIYRTDGEGIVQVNPSTTMDASGMMDMLNTGAAMGGIQQNMMDTFMKRMDVFNPLLDNEELIRSQYDILTGRLPQEKNEVVLILNSRNELSDYALYSLGLKDQGELRGQFNSLMQGKPIESVDMEFTYEDLMNITFRMLPDTEKYVKTGSIWKDMSGDEEYMRQKLAEAEEIRIVGILRPSEGTVATSSGNIGYRRELMEEMIRLVADSEIVKEQLANPDIDVFT
jgi:putative ABC transport system permease protein